MPRSASRVESMPLIRLLQALDGVYHVRHRCDSTGWAQYLSKQPSLLVDNVLGALEGRLQ